MNSSSPKWRGRPARRLLLPSILILVSCLWILVSPPAYAIVDTNNNTLSDLWEQSFNNGSLFPNIDPQTDPDADNWTNAQEAAAGTNPFDPNPPDGFLRPQITTVPATTTTPETHIISWPVRWGKQYTLLASPDLTPESWLPVGQPILGQDNAIQIATQHTGPAPDRFFWRVAVTDADTDSDSLTNAEEHQLGTNPDNYDSDNDGLPDDWEFANNLDPLDPTGNHGTEGDPDNDGWSNFQEFNGASDPNDPTEVPTNNQADNWIVLTGDQAENVQKPLFRTIAIPAGQKRLVMIAVASEEYPVWTGPQSTFNDILSWNVQPAGGQALTGTIDVNSRHDDWVEDEENGVSLQGFSPTHIEQISTFEAPSDETLFVRVQLSATNISDGILPSTVMVGLLPVEVTQVSFAGSNYHMLKSDDGNTTYNAPQWVDVNGDGTATTNTSSGEKNYPVAFTKKTMPQVGGEFKIAGLPSAQSVKIKASSAQGLQIPETSVTPAADGTITLPLTPALNNLIDSIQFYNADDDTAFKIDWEIKISEGQWCSIGSTKHTVYITMSDPIKTATGLMRETLFNIGCRNAKNMGTAEQAVVDAIYDDFKGRYVQKVRFSSGTLDGVGMHYWGDPATVGGLTTNLLSSGDGTCGAWSKLFVDVLRSQGLDARIIAFYPPTCTSSAFFADFSTSFPNEPLPSPFDLYPAFFVKSWTLGGNPFSPTDNQGVEAQSHDDPKAYFTNHAVVEYGGRIYDPSYGLDVFANKQEWEDAALDAFGLYSTSLFPNGSEIWVEKADPKGSTEIEDHPFNY